MKKLLTLSFFMLSAIMVQAYTPELYVGGVRITDDNSSNITGESISGKVSYDKSTNTLTLDNATLTRTDNNIGISTNTSLTIRLIGTNNIITERAAAISSYNNFSKKLKITSADGKGVLNLTGDTGIRLQKCPVTIENCTVNAIGNEYGIKGDNNAALNITNATVTAIGGTYGSIVGFTNIQLPDVAIMSPEGAKINDGSFVDTNGETIKTKITIAPKGDVNYDGKRNIYDLATLSNKLLGKGVSQFIKNAADMDNNDEIDIVDVARLVDILAHNGHEYVDLGLSVKWATMNVGAEKPQDYGLYFAWGATTGYMLNNGHPFNWSTAPFNGGNSEYSSSAWNAARSTAIGADKNLLLVNDAARANWGGTWRMPTYNEQTELRTMCYWEWTSNYNNTDVSGYIVYKVKDLSDKGIIKPRLSSTKTVGKYSLSDTHIFLPATGIIGGSEYWSSSLVTTMNYFAYRLSLDSSKVDWSHIYRCYGQSVRAVCP